MPGTATSARQAGTAGSAAGTDMGTVGRDSDARRTDMPGVRRGTLTAASDPLEAATTTHPDQPIATRLHEKAGSSLTAVVMGPTLTGE